MGRLANKVAIVTGAGKGLGEADARAFVREGATVWLTDVDVENGERIAAELGDRARFRSHDVRCEGTWKALVDEVMAADGRLDILVNNAGVVEMQTPETVEADAFRFVMAVSVEGMVWGIKHAIPAMRKGGGGSIVNMSSIASIQGENYVAGYCAAKGAVEAYTRAVAVHCAQAGYNIRCNSVHPSGIDTPMVRSVPQKMAEAQIQRGEEQPGGPTGNPLGTADDIANLVLFLASDESRFINGQRHVIDNTASVTQGAVPAPRG